MSVPVALEELAERIGEMGVVAYLVTVAESGLPHVVSVQVRLEGERLVTGAGRKTLANVGARPGVTLLWPAPPGSGYALLVDGTAVGSPGTDTGTGEATLCIEPTGAVLHRTPLGDPEQPSCIKVLGG